MSETIRVEGLHFSYGQGEILKGVCAGFGGAGMHGVFANLTDPGRQRC